MPQTNKHPKYVVGMGLRIPSDYLEMNIAQIEEELPRAQRSRASKPEQYQWLRDRLSIYAAEKLIGLHPEPPRPEGFIVWDDIGHKSGKSWFSGRAGGSQTKQKSNPYKDIQKRHSI